MYQNHRRDTKDKDDRLSEFDNIRWRVIMNEERTKENQIKIANGGEGIKPLFPIGPVKPSKYWFQTTSVAAGICADCTKPRCDVCNGCPIKESDLLSKDQPHCQRCLCLPYAISKEPLNNTGILLEKLIRGRAGRKKRGVSK
jgi:hypothetical protein